MNKSGKADIGLWGLAVMGENLVLNMERNGFKVAVYNRTTSKIDDFLNGPGKGKNLVGGKTIQEFVNLLEKPRKIMLMVKAGAPVDETIAQLKPFLDPGDLLIDGGNSFFQDTERRVKALESEGYCYIGTGVSGGEHGALWGPAIMPGGSKQTYLGVKPIFEAIAAKYNGESCVEYLGPGGAGHYVKMVHNGIEYGDMQLIAESYDILRRCLNLSAQEFHNIFAEWQEGELSSYLIEITRDIFLKVDDETGKPMVDLILDTAGAKGTGKWTSQNAMDVGVPIPTINAAVVSRMLSSFKKERVNASKILPGSKAKFNGDKKSLIKAVRSALYAAKICSYSQGMALLRVASNEYKYNLNLGNCAKIWRAGCIIRAKLLEDIRAAFANDPNLPNLLLDNSFKSAVSERLDDWRTVVKTAVELGIPCPALAESLAYYDAYRSEFLPANLTQAQRDYFGAHTYERLDKPGIFHTEWMPERKMPLEQKR
ncbi:MAG: NADP-dependent phosphogluconate dehydrogenase [Planctomycetota bacterium]